jgi:hypothetical protein
MFKTHLQVFDVGGVEGEEAKVVHWIAATTARVNDAWFGSVCAATGLGARRAPT